LSTRLHHQAPGSQPAIPGIRCNVIQPGFIATKMTEKIQSNSLMKKWWASR
jgi:NAD(P)-dependent dehydrogenase (short-subunit alcohol dehydrogenase family)